MSSKLAVKASDSDIQELVLDAFQERLCADRMGYDERLDFYEVRFNAAIAKLRSTARKRSRYQARRETLTYEDDTSTPSGYIEETLARLKTPDSNEECDFLYRSRLYAAISTLPADERRVVELLLQDVPIDSQDGKF